jgi:AraC-like DNA-binding protein
VPEITHVDRAHTPPSGGSRLCSNALPERDRVAIFREVYGRQVMRVDVEPLTGHPFQIDMAIRVLPGLSFLSCRRSPLRVMRTKDLISDGDDRVVLQMGNVDHVAWQCGREITLQAGDAIALENGEAGSLTFPVSGALTSLLLPRDALGPLLHDVHGCIGRPLPGNTPALRLLRHYLQILKDDSEMPTPELQNLMVAHIYDLVALALGATRHAAELARGRGVRAARLQAIKADIADHASDGDLSIADIAARHRLTPRYVQRLFESEGTTFTHFVCEQRLDSACRILASRPFDHKRIGDIAFEAGFSDLSYFNRAFRRRFGSTPSELRRNGF